jgi:hypothetical protein
MNLGAGRAPQRYVGRAIVPPRSAMLSPKPWARAKGPAACAVHCYCFWPGAAPVRHVRSYTTFEGESGRIMDEPVLAAERWIASGKLAQIAGCFFDAVQGMSSECTSTTTTARRCPEPPTQVSPRVRTLEFGRLRSTAKQKPVSASCAARRRLASSLTSPSLTLDEIRSWRVM